MESARAYRFRIYPDLKRQKEIDCQIELARLLYNKLLEKARNEHLKNKEFAINRLTLNHLMKEAILENREFKNLFSQARQNVFMRLQRTYQNFFRRVKEKRVGKRVKVGFPRFKSADKYKSITYPQFGFSTEKKRRHGKWFAVLRLSKIGRVKMEAHREIEADVKTLTVKREAGKYYAIFIAVKETECPKIKNTNPVGIDLGLNSFAVISNGSKIQKPKFMQERKKRLARWQRIVSRRQKGSKRRNKAKLKLEGEWVHIKNQSGDYLHKLSNMLVDSGYTSFVMEKLNIQEMARKHNLAGAIYNASWNKFVQLLSYKAESAGMKVILVNPQNTSKTCSNCGNIQEMPLSERVYVCNTCGMRKDRDINASINILNRATSGQGESHARGDIASTIQQESQVASLNREHTLLMQIGGGSPWLKPWGEVTPIMR